MENERIIDLYDLTPDQIAEIVEKGYYDEQDEQHFNINPGVNLNNPNALLIPDDAGKRVTIAIRALGILGGVNRKNLEILQINSDKSKFILTEKLRDIFKARGILDIPFDTLSEETYPHTSVRRVLEALIALSSSDSS